jgi:hypothetical protein
MMRRGKKQIILRAYVLCFVPLVMISAQDDPKTAKKPQSIEIQLEVKDEQDGQAINNVEVQVKWGDGKSESASGITDSEGIAKVQHVPRATVTIRLIAKGYKPFAKSFDLKTGEQPLRIGLAKLPPPTD